MTDSLGDDLEQLEQHLGRGDQIWLLGAGVSKTSGVPLMAALTERVRTKLNGSVHAEIFAAIAAELSANSNIEDFLSHLGDYIAIAERNEGHTVTCGGQMRSKDVLINAHNAALEHIASIVRWGYVPADGAQPEQVGKQNTPIIKIDAHSAFIEALFEKAQAGLQERRGPIRLFTTNYDTLIEDALALRCISYWDGFIGGAIAYWAQHFGEEAADNWYRAKLTKLHGSIDWYLDDDGHVWRVRDTDPYPDRRGRVLIYPQATKYMSTQRDPFATQFALFRRAITNSSVLAICGYSFGDEHINDEIRLSMDSGTSKTTLLIFFREGADGLSTTLNLWRRGKWGKRVFIATEKGLYVGDSGPNHGLPNDRERDWWSFSGVTALIRDGVQGMVP
jgi:SIR2-like domain